MPAFTGKLPLSKPAAAGAAPHQDQCMFPVYEDSKHQMKDSVTGVAWEIVSPATTTIDGADRVYAGVDKGYCKVADNTNKLVLKAWTGALTVLIRAWGVGSAANSATLAGNLGASGERGSAMGPNSGGDSNFYISGSSNTLVSTGNVNIFSSTPTYRDYAFVYDPGVRVTQYRDSVKEIEKTVDVPSSRYVDNQWAFVIGNRGDVESAAGGASYLVGREKFLFAYEKALTLEEIEAAFANPVYIP